MMRQAAAPPRVAAARSTAGAPQPAAARPADAAQRRIAVPPLLHDETWYYAYGSNMAPAVLTGRRRVRPRQSLPCFVPSHELSFDVHGFPYVEPGFATIVPRQLPEEQQQQLLANSSSSSSSSTRPCVHGVLHRVTRREWAYIQATEGVGSQHAGYQVVDVDCVLYDGVTVVRAATLQAAPASLHSGERRALPSRRYLGLLLEGSRHHGLDLQYQAFLARLPAYEPASSSQQAVGSLLCTAALPAYVASRALGLVPGPQSSGGGGGGAAGGSSWPLLSSLARDLNDAQRWTWRVHDALVSPLLGSGCSNGQPRAPPGTLHAGR